ncbi:ADP-ribosylglycohydrolase family protein [Neptunomonas sp.]|uniref:ADP-ribosylglycohydrolase family protein n=1 Tax=Neptunomonas sp. TaxID=1971898 RepID=UPI003563F9A6
MNKVTREQVRSSAAWAAYGDAIGFITELADSQKAVYHRAGVKRVETTIEWKRRIGGVSGATVNLPAGAYSDDTQLRLSTGRCIRSGGDFDIESFAKVELPIWSNYALGAGRGTKVAVAHLTNRDVNWFSNNYSKKGIDYIHGGGNGAAMRIQPHVWACSDLVKKKYLIDVFKNSITTHGHARGFLGSIFHAETLAYVLVNKSIPGPDEWLAFFESFRCIPDLVNQDPSLKAFWLPSWEGKVGSCLSDAIDEVVKECIDDYDLVASIISLNKEDSYHKCLVAIGGMEPSTRGSGIKTALLAAVHAWVYRSTTNPEQALAEAANILQSDTDTIATMSGALLGAKGLEFPNGKVQDLEYIISEADRCYDISINRSTTNFDYPDLFTWTPPKTLVDIVSGESGSPELKGLGMGIAISETYLGKGEHSSIWQWVQLPFGQTVLAKMRPLWAFEIYRPLPVKVRQITEDVKNTASSTDNKPPAFKPPQVKSTVELHKLNIDQMSDFVIQHGFDEKLIGRCILELSTRELGVESAIAFAGIIVKAKGVRARRKPSDLSTLI